MVDLKVTVLKDLRYQNLKKIRQKQRVKKSFLYTYFVELLNSEGPIKLEYVLKKWESVNFQEVKKFLPQYDGIVKFLLASCQCAVVEDTMCLAKDLAVAYNASKTDLVDGLNFALMDTSSLEDNGTESNNHFVDTCFKNESNSNSYDKPIVELVSNSLDNSSSSKLENKNSGLPFPDITVVTPPTQEDETMSTHAGSDSYSQDAKNKILIDFEHESESNSVKPGDNNTIEIAPKLPEFLSVLEAKNHNHNSQTSEIPSDSEESFVKEMQLSDRKPSYNFMFDVLKSSSVEEKLPLENIETVVTNNISLQSSRDSFLITEQMKFESNDKEECVSGSNNENIPVQTEVRKTACSVSEFVSDVLQIKVKEEEFVNKLVIPSLHYPHCAFDETKDWIDESLCDIDMGIPPPPAEFSDETVLPEAVAEPNDSAKTIDISLLEVPLEITESSSIKDPDVEDIIKQTQGGLEKMLSEEHKQSEEDTKDDVLTGVTVKLQNILTKPIQEHESHNVKQQDTLGEILGTLKAILPKYGTNNNSAPSEDKSTEVKVDREQDETKLKLEKLCEEISQKDKIMEEMKEKYAAELSELKEKNSAERKAKDEILELCKQMVNYVKYSEFKKLDIYKKKFLKTKELLEIVDKNKCLKTCEDKFLLESLRKLDQSLKSVEEYDDKLQEWYTFQCQELNNGNIKKFRFPFALPDDIDSTHNTSIEIFEKLTERHASNSKDEESNVELEATIKTTWDTEKSNSENGKSEPVPDSETSSPLSHKPYQQYHIPDLNSSTLHRSLATALIYDKSGRSLMDVGCEDEKLPNSVHTSDMSQLGAASLTSEINSAAVISFAKKELAPLANYTISYGHGMTPHQMKMEAPSELQDVSKTISAVEGAPLQFQQTTRTERKNSLCAIPSLLGDKKNEFTSSSGIGSVPGIPFNFMQHMPVNYVQHMPINYPNHMAINYPQYMQMNYPYPQHAETITVPNVPPVTSLPKPRVPELTIDNRNRSKLLNKLRAKFPFKKREEVEDVLSRLRREKGHLSGMRVCEICNLLEKELDKSSKKRETGPMGMEKFGGSAWGDVKETIAWSKPQENEVDDCVICMEPLTDGLETLSCNHDFHKKCVRRWFKENRVCPLCQVYTTVREEFPPLS